MSSPSVQSLEADSGNPIALFFNSAITSPDSLALVSARTKLTYRQLERLARQIARKLSKLGIKSGDVVGTQCQPEITVVLWLALLQLGATSLTVSKTTLASYGQYIKTVLVDDNFSRLKHDKVQTLGSEFFESLDATAPLDEIAELQSESLVRVVFSSGTTGVPKAVPFSVEVFLARVESARSNWIPIQPFMSMLGPETVTGFQTVFAQLFSGNTCYLPSESSNLWGLIIEHRIRSIKTSPAKLADLVRSSQELQRSSALENSLSIIQVAGSLLPKSLATACQVNLKITPTYLYGSTEVGTVSRGQFNQSHPNSVGVVISEVDLEIVDEHNHVLPLGQIGFIRARRSPMAQSYWKSSQITANGFSNGWFYPGDRGVLSPKRELLLEGRSDDLVNAGGLKVNLAQLDQMLGDIKEVSDVATFEFFGDFGEPLLGLAFTAGGSPEIKDIERLAQLHAPGIRFNALVRLDSIPRNSLGKVQRKDLASHIKGESN